MTTTADLDARITALYRAKAAPQLLEVPDLTYLMIDGHGDPNGSEEYAEAIRALYAVSYGAKFALRRSLGINVKVSPLEGLWWSEDMSSFGSGDRREWEWTALIRQPAEADKDLLIPLADEIARTKEIPAARRLRREVLSEGTAGQILHIGPYSSEGPTIARLHAFIAERGLRFDGRIQKHHEIYLSDPRRSSPERLRTIIRQPVVTAA